MDIELLLYGSIGFLLGLVAMLSDNERSLREKKSVPLGPSGAKFKVSYWTLMTVGILMILFGLF